MKFKEFVEKALSNDMIAIVKDIAHGSPENMKAAFQILLDNNESLLSSEVDRFTVCRHENRNIFLVTLISSDVESRINDMLNRESLFEECSIDEVKELLIKNYGEYGPRGYGIFESDDVEAEHIERIDVLNVYDSDLEAAEQAEKDGVKLIPFELNPKAYPYNCYRFIDTPENREKLKYIKLDQYFYDDNGNEYWYGEDNKKHYTRDEG